MRNHGGISSGASGNRLFAGFGREVDGWPGARNGRWRRRDSTGHGGGSNLLLRHHSRKRERERGTRLEDEGTGRGREPDQRELERSDACLVSSDVVEVDVSFIRSLPTAMNIFRLIGEPTHTSPSSLMLMNVFVCR